MEYFLAREKQNPYNSAGDANADSRKKKKCVLRWHNEEKGGRSLGRPCIREVVYQRSALRTTTHTHTRTQWDHRRLEKKEKNVKTIL
jgi:hypothetical protein